MNRENRSGGLRAGTSKMSISASCPYPEAENTQGVIENSVPARRPVISEPGGGWAFFLVSRSSFP